MSFFRGDSSELPPAEKNPLTPEEQAIVDKIANKTVEKGMSVPAILFLESVKPLNFIASQVLVFFEPIVQSLFSFKAYDTFRSALEKRESIEILLLKIEEYDAVAFKREKRLKKFLKEEKKKWKWYQRYLGILLPKYTVPDEIINPPEDENRGKETTQK